MSKRAKIGPWGAVPIALLTDNNVTQNMLKVYICLSSYQGTNGKCWPSRDEISRSSGIKPYAVSKALTDLVNAGWIERKRRSEKRKTNVYVVLSDVQEINPDVGVSPISEKSRCRSESDAGCRSESDIPLYNKDTNIQHHMSTPSAAPMKDPIAQLWETKLTDKQPSSTWGSYGKERKHCKILASRTRELIDQVPYETEEEIIDAVIEEYGRMKRTARNEYWKGAPWIPSQLISRWPAIWESLAKRHESERIGAIADEYGVF